MNFNMIAIDKKTEDGKISKFVDKIKREREWKGEREWKRGWEDVGVKKVEIEWDI